MSKINCSLIKDLLPLYIDELCSKESTEVIKNHLEVCEECNKEYETLKKEPKIKPQQDNSQELIKKVNKRFGKEKKKAVLKTLSVILVVLILVGVFAFLKLPLYMAQNDFLTSGVCYPNNYEEWEICDNKKNNFNSKHVDLYIDKKYGEYEIVENDESLDLKFEDGKEIFVINIDRDLEEVPTFDDKETFFPDREARYPFLPFVIKRGLENLGVKTDVALGYRQDVYTALITNEPPTVKLFSSYDDYATACAYYGCFEIMMPVVIEQEYYLIGESKDFTAWGWTTFAENHSAYAMHYQSKKDLNNTCTIQVIGFTKEEAQEILKYAVVK